MSYTNVKIIERSYVTDVVDMAPFIHPDAVFREAEGLPYSGDCIGPEGFRAMIVKIRSEFRLEPTGRPEAIDVGDARALVMFETCFTSLRTGVALTTWICEMYRLEDGLITENDIYYKDPAGVAALYESQPGPSAP